MIKIKSVLKLLFLLPLLLLVLPFDGLMFAFANSCASCSSFPQYLLSSVSFFGIIWASIGAVILFLKKNK